MQIANRSGVINFLQAHPKSSMDPSAGVQNPLMSASPLIPAVYDICKTHRVDKIYQDIFPMVCRGANELVKLYID